MRNKVVVFDLDDTLYKEIDFLKSAYLEIANLIESKYHKIHVYEFMIKCYSEKKNVFSELNNHYSLDIPLKEYISIYRSHLPNLKLKEDIRETLQLLKNHSIILGILTDGRSFSQKNKIKALNLNDFFKEDNILISEEFGSEKPSLENYKFFQNKYPEASYYYVGDNTNKDFIGANKLNWTTICLLDNGENIHKQDFMLNDEFLPTYQVDKIKDLIHIL